MSQWFPTIRKIQHTPIRDLLRLQLSGRLNWRAKVAECDLPERAKRKIIDVVKATRLWRIEKAQITDDLISHFADGLNSGRDINKLLDTFGDTATVALLMRSAKKRNRSIFWKAIIACGYAFVVFLIFYAGLAIWFISGKPNPSVDYYEVVSADAKAVPNDQRAWPIYRDVWIKYDFVRLNVGVSVGQELGESWNAWRPGDEKWPNVVSFLKQHEPLVKAIRRGGQLSGFGLELKRRRDYAADDSIAMFGPESLSSDSSHEEANGESLVNGALVGALLTQVQEMRKMARVMEVDVFRMADAGDAKLAEENILAMVGLGPQAGELPFLVSGLIGMALDSIAYNTIDELLTKYPKLLNERQLERIARKIRRFSPRDLLTLDGERSMQLDLIQRLYSDDGYGDGRLTDEGLTALPGLLGMVGTKQISEQTRFVQLLGPGVALLSGSRKQTENALARVMDEYEASIGVPVYQKPIQDGDHFRTLVEKYASNDIGTTYFMELLLPAIQQVRIAGERLEGLRNGILMRLAVHRYYLTNGKFPESTDELVPNWIGSIPNDVLTGKPLKYSLVDDLPLIYSIGADGDDDGGVDAFNLHGEKVSADRHIDPNTEEETDGDWILWPAQSD